MSNQKIDAIKLKDYAEESYLNYSMYVILDRALPNIGDGMKPASFHHQYLEAHDLR